MTLLERFKKHVAFLDDSDDSCWIWTGALLPTAGVYGRFKINGKNHRAHRIAWELLSGKRIPKGYKLVQECAQPQCVRHWRLDKRWKKLTDEQIRQIRSAHSPSHALAVVYGVSSAYIRKIRCGAVRALRDTGSLDARHPNRGGGVPVLGLDWSRSA